MLKLNTFILKLKRCPVIGLGLRKCSNTLDLSSEIVTETKQKKHIEFYMKLLDLNFSKAKIFLEANPSLRSASFELNDVFNTAEYLKLKNYSIAEIMERPKILQLNRSTLVNRSKTLEECSFNEIQMMFFVRYVSIMNKNVNMLKAYKYIDHDVDVTKKLLACLNVNTTVSSGMGENISLNEMRKRILNMYLKENINCTNQDLTKLWNTYPRLKHKNYASIVAVVDILHNILHFNDERIMNNAYLLYADPENIISMLNEIKTIAGFDVREILMRRPKIMMSNCGSIKKIIMHIKSFDIPEVAIGRCLEVLTLGPDTVFERLLDLKKISEFNVLCHHPRILRLIHYQNKARTRLDYLKQLKVKCVSLHVLSSSSDTFEKYAREGIDKTKGKDIVLYLSKIFKKDDSEVRNCLARHPNWCHVPILTVKSSLDFLKYKKFNLYDIYENIHVLLYPISRIEDKLNALLEWKSENNDNQKISGVCLSSISNNKMLALCLYFIESEFHFSGDGIWQDQHNQQDCFPSTIPDFPKTLTKIYKYGVVKKVEQIIENK